MTNRHPAPISALSLLALVAGLTVGCASGTRLSSVEPLPKDLPEELQAKFEITDANSAPKPTPSPSGVAKTKKSKSEKKKPAPVAPAFVYPDRRPKINPIWIGEKHVFEITYIGLAAGDFTMEVQPFKKVGERKVYPLRATAVSSSVMNFFYRVNDSLESFWDAQGLFSHRFHLILDQTKQTRDAIELYDSEKKKAFYWNRRDHVEKGKTESKDYSDIPSFPQDSFSALYYLRALPLEDGKVYTFPVVSEGKPWEAEITVVRREIMDTPMGKKNCIVVRPRTRYSGVLKQEHGESYIWLTDDERRIIVRIDAKIKVGSITAQLKKIELGEKPNEG